MIATVFVFHHNQHHFVCPLNMFTAACIVASLGSVIAGAPELPNELEEIMIPMRDGVKLHTMIYFPREKDDVKDGEDQPRYPAVLDRSPYGYGDMEWLTDIFLPFGFVAIGQDMRGTELSEGNFTMWQSDTEDSRDVGDWIVQQPWSNGQIYTFGASADAIGSLQTPGSEPDWIAGQYIAVATNAFYDMILPGGTFKQRTAEDWLGGLTMPNPDVVNDNIDTLHEHEMHDSYWANIELHGEADFGKVKAPSAFWGGWYDLFLMGTLTAFDGYNDLSDASVRYTSKIMVDTCGHCVEMQDFFTENIIMGRTAVGLAQLFELYGIRPVSRSEIKNVTFYVMSSVDEAGRDAGQYWTSLEKFPTPTMTDYYFQPDHSATLSPATETEEVTSTTYTFDPANPQDTMGGSNLSPAVGGTIECGPLDQAEVDKRADVVSFETAVFEEELPLTGPLMATLFVSSDAIDTDFMVRISDVYPTGEALLIQDNALRMRWRDAQLTPVYLEKGEVYEVEMSLWNTSYVVAPGHALRFSVSSSNYPRFSVNPNNGILLADTAYPGENITATNTIFHSAAYPSKVTLPVVTKSQIREVHVLRAAQEAYPHLTDELLKATAPKLDGMFKRMANRVKK